MQPGKCRGCVWVAAQQQSSWLKPVVCYRQLIWQSKRLACELRHVLPASSSSRSFSSRLPPAPRLPHATRHVQTLCLCHVCVGQQFGGVCTERAQHYSTIVTPGACCSIF
jgi:hypothetical protein